MIELAVRAAREAGVFLRENIGNVRHVRQKDGEGRNLVSEIDRGSEEMIIRMIRGTYPDHSILAEEGGTGGASPEYRWIIDPLDGTTNYLHGIPVYCVTIGIEHRGELTGGVIYDPNLDELFVAEKGKGATVNGSPIRVSSTSDLEDGVLVTGFPYDIMTNPDRAIERFVALLKASRGVRRLGSAALDLSWVAMGRFDGFWEVNLHPWDIAGGIVIVREAGGTVTDFSGGAVDVYGKQIVASNGLLHRRIITAMEQAPD